MNKTFHELAAWSLEKAKAAGANACRVTISGDRFVEISYRERKPENTREASRRTLSIDIYAEGRYSSQSTSDLRKETLQGFITNAVATTKLLEEDPFRSLPDAKYCKLESEVDLDIVDATYDTYGADDRHALVKAVEGSCLKRGGDKVISVTAETSDRRRESVMVASNGFEGYETATTYTIGAEMTAQDEGDRRPNGSHYLTTVKRSELPSAESIGAGAAERTLDLLGAKKIKTETLPIIIENRIAPRVLFGLLEAMFGRSIQQKRSFLADKQGEKIGSELLTVIDDPHIKGALRSRLYDDDGLTARKRTMIDKGVLKEFWVDWYYSRKLKWEPTVGFPANLVVPPGKRSVEEIMKDLKRGVLVTGFIGGNSNSTTGDASVGIIGKLFDEGKPVQSIAEMNIADNHLKLWHRLAEVGNDPWIYSPFRLPSLVLTDVVVSGA